MKTKGAGESSNGSTQNWKYLKNPGAETTGERKEFPVIGENFDVVVPGLEIKFE